MTLSDRQQRIMAFIRKYWQEHAYPPTIREIGQAVKISSTSVVKYNLERLQEKGLIERSGEVSRGLRLTDGSEPRFITLPIYGTIAAGAPIPAFGQQEDPFAGETLALTQDLVPNAGELYVLRVKGDSMVDALVYDGDYVVIRHMSTAQPRDMVVAWRKDREETTLKYYFPEGERVRLQPANPAYDPIYVPADQLEIQGKVVAVVRQIP